MPAAALAAEHDVLAPIVAIFFVVFLLLLVVACVEQSLGRSRKAFGDAVIAMLALLFWWFWSEVLSAKVK